MRFVSLFLLIMASLIDYFRAHPLSLRLCSHDLQKQRKVVSQLDEYVTQYYTQLLYHFSFVSQFGTFQQRYLVNRTFCGGPLNNSPIFVWMGGKESLDPRSPASLARTLHNSKPSSLSRYKFYLSKSYCVIIAILLYSVIISIL